MDAVAERLLEAVETRVLVHCEVTATIGRSEVHYDRLIYPLAERDRTVVGLVTVADWRSARMG